MFFLEGLIVLFAHVFHPLPLHCKPRPHVLPFSTIGRRSAVLTTPLAAAHVTLAGLHLFTECMRKGAGILL